MGKLAIRLGCNLKYMLFFSRKRKINFFTKISDGTFDSSDLTIDEKEDAIEWLEKSVGVFCLTQEVINNNNTSNNNKNNSNNNLLMDPLQKMSWILIFVFFSSIT